MVKYDNQRKNVLNASLWLLEHGYFGSQRGTGGNVSVRIDDKHAFAITPTSAKYQELSVDDICVVSFDLSVIEGKENLKPSVESGMHGIIYRMRPDVNAVVHTHQLFGSVFALINEPIPPLFDETSFSLGHTIEVVPYALSGSEELVKNVEGRLSNNANAYIIQNHGILALGKNLDKALLNVELLEKAAQTYCLALSTGKVIHTLPESVRDMVFALRNQEVEDAREKMNKKEQP
ncbi:MAG TPA: class II aldolase/adducin family protein [Desulfomonilia bacterium]|nr:class II aldolase/adducin family protein [Desulfomonilia bacterium]